MRGSGWQTGRAGRGCCACIELADPDGVLAEAQVMFDDSQNE